MLEEEQEFVSVQATKTGMAKSFPANIHLFKDTVRARKEASLNSLIARHLQKICMVGNYKIAGYVTVKITILLVENVCFLKPFILFTRIADLWTSINAIVCGG